MLIIIHPKGTYGNLFSDSDSRKYPPQGSRYGIITIKWQRTVVREKSARVKTLMKSAVILTIFISLLIMLPDAYPGGVEDDMSRAGSAAAARERIRARIRLEIAPILRRERLRRYDIAGIKRVTDIARTEEIENEKKLVYRWRLYFNYDYFLRGARDSSLPLISPGDFLFEPGAGKDFVLHQELLEAMYAEHMRFVFFVTDVPPYFPGGRYNRIPWLRDRTSFYFGNAFWDDAHGISRLYRTVYGTAAADFNSQMRRVEMYMRMDEKPKAVVFALLERTGANEQWRYAWEWSQYYYFTGIHIYLP